MRQVQKTEIYMKNDFKMTIPKNNHKIITLEFYEKLEVLTVGKKDTGKP